MTTRPTLLLQERPLIVLPQLACAVGLNEAIVLQQLHYWLIEGGTPHEGRRWVYNSYEQWQVDNFPFWSVPTIRRIFANLEREGLVDSRIEYDPRFQGSRRKWYTIDYDVVRAKEGKFLNGGTSGDQVDHDSAREVEKASHDQPDQTSGDQVDQSSRDQSDQTSGDQNDQTLYTENTTENTKTAAAPKNGATARAQAKPKKPRQRDPIFDAIAECSFSVPVGAEVAKDTAQRVGKVKREVLTIYPDVTEHELRGAYSWHVNAQKLTAPRDPVKVVTMVGVYRAQHRPAAASAIVRDPDCAVCGGTGLVLPALGAYEDGDPRANTPIQCPACVKAVRASEAQREAVGP